MKSVSKYLLLIVPFAYFFIGSYFHQIIGLYSLRTADPEYAYFMSGLCVANGKFMLGHIDHPGSPLQYLAAIVFRGVYLFRSHHVPFNNDVLANPDLYLQNLNLVLIAVVAVFIYFSGIIVLRISKRLTYSVLVQLTPVFSSLIYLNVARIIPEILIQAPIVLMSILIIKQFYNVDDEKKISESVLFGLISGLGLSIKLTYAPLLILPLILLKKWKNKLIYSGIAIFSFFAFAFPVTLQFKKFWNWTTALIMNSGKYGQGESNFIDWKSFFANFANLWNENRFIFYLLIALIILMVLTTVLNIRKKGIAYSVKVSFAILIAATIQVIMVCKQYESRYFEPAYMLIPLVLIMIILLLQEFHALIGKFKLAQIAVIIVVAFYFNAQKSIVHSLSIVLQERNEQKMKAAHYLKNIESNALKFIVTTDYGAPLPEYALTHSYRWAGRYQDLFKPALAELYPNTYVFFPWDNSLNYWGAEPDFSVSERPAYIYFLTDNLSEKFFQDAAQYFPEKYELTRPFFNESTNEAIYRLVKVSSE